MINPHRGDVGLILEGTMHRLRLTLGSLAMLEEALGSNGLHELSVQLQAGRLSSKDICHVLAAGFCGAGVQKSVEEIGSMIPASALVLAAEAAANLLSVTFGGGTPSRPPPPQVP
jgi:Phage tail tube protein, GTA-gp10